VACQPLAPGEGGWGNDLKEKLFRHSKKKKIKRPVVGEVPNRKEKERNGRNFVKETVE